MVSQFNQAVESLTEGNRQLCAKFTAYFKSTWLDGLFKISMWNKFDQDFLHRTNNRVESWHAALKLKVPNNPNIYVLISALKAEESNAQIVLAKQQAGDSPPPRRQKYEKFEAALKKAFL